MSHPTPQGAQRATTAAGPTTHLILGPPGTGKTTRLMAIIEAELAGGTRPEDIVFVSFTRAAVHEARDRACTKFGFSPEQFTGFRTIHSLAYRLTGGDILSGSDYAAFEARYHYHLTPTTKDARDDGDYAPPAQTRDDDLRAAVEWSRCRMVPIREGLRTFDRPVDPAAVEEFAARYSAFKREARKIDFTDMLERCLSVEAAPRCECLIVDEAQDLSPLQIGLIDSVWTPKCRRRYIAGDDDQAIYQFSGAEPDWLILLAADPGVQTEVLAQSWRVPRAAWAVAQSIIGENRRRVAKAYAPADREGSVATLWLDEAIGTIDASESTFLLSRTSRPLGEIAGGLREARIPYVCERGGRGPLGRPALVEAVRVAARIRDGLEITARELAALAEYVPVSMIGKRGAKKAIAEAAEHEGPCRLDLGDLRAAILREGPAGVLTLHGTTVEDRDYLGALISGRSELPAPSVSLTTIHGSKGREADHVIVLSDHPWPVEAACQSADPESERRVAYVAVTRTRDRLTIVRPETRYHYPYPTWAADQAAAAK